MRWVSVFLLLGCLGAIQWTVVVKLHRQNESLHQSAAAFEGLRRDNQEGQRLRGDAREIERLREENSELLKLRNEARQSREKIRELEEKLVRQETALQNRRPSQNEPHSKSAEEQFLADNKNQPGVVALPSGLQYKILTPGAGAVPTKADTVVTHYRGTLIDGTEFDSSYKRGEPASFPLTAVIKGWTEALLLMPVGSKWQLFIPSELAYGERGAGKNLPGNSTLIFEVELLSIPKN